MLSLTMTTAEIFANARIDNAALTSRFAAERAAALLLAASVLRQVRSGR